MILFCYFDRPTTQARLSRNRQLEIVHSEDVEQRETVAVCPCYRFTKFGSRSDAIGTGTQPGPPT